MPDKDFGQRSSPNSKSTNSNNHENKHLDDEYLEVPSIGSPPTYHFPNLLSPKTLLHLQRQIGNQAVIRLLQRHAVTQKQSGSREAADVEDKAHLEPSNQSNPGVIQRAIGFEFETGVPIRKGNKQIGYKEEVYASLLAFQADPANVHSGAGGWRIHADDSSLEFVTEPAQRLNQVSGAVDQMQQFIARLQANMRKPANRQETFEKVGELFDNPPGKVYKPDNHVIGETDKPKPERHTLEQLSNFFGAKIQVTMGIPLAEIADFLFPQAGAPKPMLNSFGNATPLYEPTSHFGLHQLPKPRVLADRYIAEANLNNLPAWEKKPLVGFVALICDKLNDLLYTHMNDSPAAYPKSEFNLLHRTDFVSMYQSLTAQTRQHFNVGIIGTLWVRTLWEQNNALNHAKMPASLEQSRPAVLDGTVLTNTLEPIAMGVLNNLRAFGKGINIGGEQTAPGPTTGAWLQSIPSMNPVNPPGSPRQGKDLLSRPPVTSNSESMGQFNMDTQDPSVGGTAQALFEIRRIGGQVNFTEWKTIAEELYNVYHSMMYKRLQQNFMLGQENKTRQDKLHNKEVNPTYGKIN